MIFSVFECSAAVLHAFPTNISSRNRSAAITTAAEIRRNADTVVSRPIEVNCPEDQQSLCGLCSHRVLILSVCPDFFIFLRKWVEQMTMWQPRVPNEGHHVAAQLLWNLQELTTTFVRHRDSVPGKSELVGASSDHTFLHRVHNVVWLPVDQFSGHPAIHRLWRS